MISPFHSGTLQHAITVTRLTEKIITQKNYLPFFYAMQPYTTPKQSWISKEVDEIFCCNIPRNAILSEHWYVTSQELTWTHTDVSHLTSEDYMINTQLRMHQMMHFQWTNLFRMEIVLLAILCFSFGESECLETYMVQRDLELMTLSCMHELFDCVSLSSSIQVRLSWIRSRHPSPQHLT